MLRYPCSDVLFFLWLWDVIVNRMSPAVTGQLTKRKRSSNTIFWGMPMLLSCHWMEMVSGSMTETTWVITATQPVKKRAWYQSNNISGGAASTAKHSHLSHRRWVKFQLLPPLLAWVLVATNLPIGLRVRKDVIWYMRRTRRPRRLPRYYQKGFKQNSTNGTRQTGRGAS